MLKNVKGKALPGHRYEMKMDNMSKSDFSLPNNSSKFVEKRKKALHKNVKNHSESY